MKSFGLSLLSQLQVGLKNSKSIARWFYTWSFWMAREWCYKHPGVPWQIKPAKVLLKTSPNLQAWLLHSLEVCFLLILCLSWIFLKSYMTLLQDQAFKLIILSYCVKNTYRTWCIAFWFLKVVFRNSTPLFLIIIQIRSHSLRLTYRAGYVT